MERSPSLACAILLVAASFANLTPAAGQTVAPETATLKAMPMELAGVNAAIKAAGARWTAGDNPIMHLTPAQRKIRLGLKKGASGLSGSVMSMEMGATASLPASLDWRNYNGKNYVTAVEDQGDCGSCWAFATTGGLESYVRRTQNNPGQNVDLSEQIVLSCSNAGNCEIGGDPTQAAKFMQATGVGPASAYPYTQTDGNCSAAAKGWQKGAERIGKVVTVTGATPTAAALKKALATYGPLPTTMAVYEDFFSYTSGVYSYTGGIEEGGHAVLLVGYDDANQCFIVKNSWGPGWGENGYFRIAYSELSSVVNFGADTIAFSSAAPTALSVAIMSPANNASVSGTITISGTAADTATNVLVSKVEVRADNEEFLPASGTTKWSYSLNTSQLGNGKHVITVHAINTTGATASASMAINVSGDPPAITSPAIAAVLPGAAFTYAITATDSPTSFGATGLPAGLSLHAKTGVISGAVAQAGTYNFTVSATNIKGTRSQAVTLYVGAPAITSAATSSGVVGTSFSYAIKATNAPTSFSATGLPAGLSLNAQTGVISGFPTVVFSSNVTLGATNAAGTGSQALALAITLPPLPVITSAASVSGVVGKQFTYSITATNKPLRFAATGLPQALGYDPYAGYIGGYLLQGGTFTVTLSATNLGGTATKALTLYAVVPPPPVITSPSAVTGYLGINFGYMMTATNSPDIYNAYNLPPGLGFSYSPQEPDTSIYGTPTKLGVFNVPISVTNGGGTGKTTLVITITQPPTPVINSAATAAGKVGQSFYYFITTVKGATSYGATGLPPGLSIDTKLGCISGTPTKTGTYSVGLSAKDALGTGTKTLAVTIQK